MTMMNSLLIAFGCFAFFYVLWPTFVVVTAKAAAFGWRLGVAKYLRAFEELNDDGEKKKPVS